MVWAVLTTKAPPCLHLSYLHSLWIRMRIPDITPVPFCLLSILPILPFFLFPIMASDFHTASLLYTNSYSLLTLRGNVINKEAELKEKKIESI